MEKQIAFCGIECNTCPAFIATQKNDNEARKKVAEEWSKPSLEIKPEDVHCNGCISKTAMNFCNDCGVRNCGINRGVKNCAYCDEYACEKLQGHWKTMNMTEAKATLDGIRSKLNR